MFSIIDGGAAQGLSDTPISGDLGAEQAGGDRRALLGADEMLTLLRTVPDAVTDDRDQPLGYRTGTHLWPWPYDSMFK